MEHELFSESGPLSGLFAELRELGLERVQAIPEDELTLQPASRHAEALFEQLAPQLPSLLLDRVSLKREVLSRQSFIRFSVPFAGTGALFSYRPDELDCGGPRAEVCGPLVIWVPMSGLDGDQIEAIFRGTLREIEERLQLVGDSLVSFEREFSAELLSQISERRERVILERATTRDLLQRFGNRETP
jgi:hypothetical protein